MTNMPALAVYMQLSNLRDALSVTDSLVLSAIIKQCRDLYRAPKTHDAIAA
jgi:hypothetical protein